MKRLVEIIQISDLHYGSEFLPESFENIINYIEDNKPDAVVCTGDLIHKGRIKQLKGILPYINRIKEITKFLAVPGNHDSKNSGIIFFERYIGPRRSILILEEKNTVIAGICSARDDMSEGRIGDEQLDWLGRHIDRNLENKVLALHHHLIPIPMSGQKFTTVRDAGEIIEFNELFEIDLVLMGHRHVPHAYVIEGSTSSFATTYLYCGTSTSNKVRADDSPSFNHITLDEGDLEVHMIDSLSLEKKPLIERKKGFTKFARPRKTRIEHLLSSPVWDD